MSASTLSPDQIIRHFSRMYTMVYDHEPRVNYIGNGWFQVNGEATHHTVLLQELERLDHMVELQRVKSPKTSAIQKLINKLRFM